MSKSKIDNLTNKKLLAGNILYSFLGQGVPLVVAIFSMPLLINRLGTDRFGILTIAWMIISYFSLFDLGLGRALTQLVADKLGKEEDEALAHLIWTASLLMLILGFIGSIFTIKISPWLIFSALKIPKHLQHETLHTFYALGISIPFITISSSFVGVLSSFQRFDLINLVKTPLSALIFIIPLIVIPFSNSLFTIVGSLILLRLISLFMYIYFCINIFPALRTKKIKINREELQKLFKFGSWMTISNMISPLMVYLDRFLIGGIISVTAVAYYTTPYEIVTKLWLIPGAFVGVLFPAFSSTYNNGIEKTLKLFKQGVIFIFLSLFPIICIIIFFANDILRLWIGNEFATNSSLVLQLLAIGVFINSLSQVPFSLIQGIGRPDITAKLHLIELPIYLICIWSMLHIYGVAGAAFAWSIRIIIDTIFLFKSTQKFLIHTNIFNRNILVSAITIPIILLCLALLITQIYIKLITCIAVIIIFTITAWALILSPSDKAILKKKIHKDN
jgi:O-antigen/teichoic acid export membrane protein